MSKTKAFFIRPLLFLLSFALAPLWLSALAASPEDFYAGKTISLVIGISAGGGYDLYARVLAKYLGNYIPGKPTIVPRNMPGAGSLNATTYLAEVAPRDGTVIGTFSRGMPIYPLLFKAGYDGSKFGYIGSITTDTSVCITWRTSKIKTWRDALTIPSVFGGQGKGADPDLFATLLQQLFAAKIKLVTGYPGNADIMLAMQRGEVDGLCGLSYSTLKSTHAAWLRDHDVNIIVQAALDKDPELPDAPSLLDLATQTKQRQILKLAVAPQAMARPFAMPPDTPNERLQELRAAFDATMKDPAFLAEAARLKLDVHPLSGPKIEDLVKQLYATPKDVVREAARAMGG